jgi:pimeloyl-ACP methyl ester carboxylesterase
MRRNIQPWVCYGSYGSAGLDSWKSSRNTSRMPLSAVKRRLKRRTSNRKSNWNRWRRFGTDSPVSVGATFVLVHGTFAKAADWPALQDSLGEAAREAGETACFKQLPWSGQNRAAAREGAASAILKSVQDIQSNSNNEKIFLIGHSHGGSAIAYFLKQYTEVAKTLSGCAFLSTPFIAMRPRNKAIAHAVFFFLVLAFQFYFAQGAGVNSLVWILGSVVLIISVGLISGSYASRDLLDQTIRQQTADIPLGNYFFIRRSGDEAAAFLSAAQFINWLNMKASKMLMLLQGGKGLFRFRFLFSLGVMLLLLYAPYLFWTNLMPTFAAHGGIVGYFKWVTLARKDALASVLSLSVIVAACLLVLCLLLAFFIILVQALT